MPVVWDDAREKRLLLEVIAICNPTVDRSAWEGVAAVLGNGASAEGCRQKFQAIKRNLKAANGSTNPSTPTSALKHSSKGAKTKAPATASTSTNGNASKGGRKRKAADANVEDPADDEESTLFAPKAQKVKTEKVGDSAEAFKAEELGDGEGVDVERDDLYSDHDAA